MLRRAPFTLLAALVVGLVLWWSQTGGDQAEPPGADTGVVDSTGPAVGRGPSTIGPAEEPSGGRGQQAPPGAESMPTVALDDLPAEAAEVVAAIDAGGPYAHPDKDGTRFGNYEGLLPQRPRGHYREFTVPTPGLDHRGARRIVTGQGGEMYWTDDHYESFARILR